MILKIRKMKNISYRSNTLTINKHKTAFLYLLLVLSYFFSYFFRVSTSVVLPIIQADWDLGASVVGFISSMYYYTYALMQPICGVLNDKTGPTKVVGAGIIITSLGSLCFGLGQTTTMLIIGRLLMGIGLSPMLSGLLVFQGTHFSPERYAFFSGLSMMIGNMGAVFSVGPLSFALKTWGRASIFTGLAIATLLIAFSLLVFGKEQKPEMDETFPHMVKSRLKLAYGVVRRSRGVQGIIVIWMLTFGSLMAYQGLWAVSWFKEAYPEHASLASTAATFIGIGVMAGNFIGGSLCKQAGERHRIIRNLVAFVFLAWSFTILCFGFHALFALTVGGSFFIGMTNGMLYTQLTAGINDISPFGQGGAVFGIVNCITFICVLVFQWGTGVMIEQFARHMAASGAYIRTFLLVLATLVVPCITGTRLKEFRKIS